MPLLSTALGHSEALLVRFRFAGGARLFRQVAWPVQCAPRMNDQPKPPNKPAVAAKPKPPRSKPAIRLDDLIPNEKVLGGRRVTFGVRAKPVSKS